MPTEIERYTNLITYKGQEYLNLTLDDGNYLELTTVELGDDSALNRNHSPASVELFNTIPLPGDAIPDASLIESSGIYSVDNSVYKISINIPMNLAYLDEHNLTEIGIFGRIVDVDDTELFTQELLFIAQFPSIYKPALQEDGVGKALKYNFLMKIVNNANVERIIFNYVEEISDDNLEELGIISLLASEDLAENDPVRTIYKDDAVSVRKVKATFDTDVHNSEFIDDHENPETLVPSLNGYGFKSGRGISTWRPSFAYEIGDCIVPTAGSDDYFYICTFVDTISGASTESSDVSEPSFPVIEEETVVDGFVTWTCYEKRYNEFDGSTLDSYVMNLNASQESFYIKSLGIKAVFSKKMADSITNIFSHMKDIKPILSLISDKDVNEITNTKIYDLKEYDSSFKILAFNNLFNFSALNNMNKINSLEKIKDYSKTFQLEDNIFIQFFIPFYNSDIEHKLNYRIIKVNNINDIELISTVNEVDDIFFDAVTEKALFNFKIIKTNTEYSDGVPTKWKFVYLKEAQEDHSFANSDVYSSYEEIGGSSKLYLFSQYNLKEIEINNDINYSNTIEIDKTFAYPSGEFGNVVELLYFKSIETYDKIFVSFMKVPLDSTFRISENDASFFIKDTAFYEAADHPGFPNVEFELNNEFYKGYALDSLGDEFSKLYFLKSLDIKMETCRKDNSYYLNIIYKSNFFGIDSKFFSLTDDRDVSRTNNLNIFLIPPILIEKDSSSYDIGDYINETGINKEDYKNLFSYNVDSDLLYAKKVTHDVVNSEYSADTGGYSYFKDVISFNMTKNKVDASNEELLVSLVEENFNYKTFWTYAQIVKLTTPVARTLTIGDKITTASGTGGAEGIVVEILSEDYFMIGSELCNRSITSLIFETGYILSVNAASASLVIESVIPSKYSFQTIELTKKKYHTNELYGFEVLKDKDAYNLSLHSFKFDMPDIKINTFSSDHIKTLQQLNDEKIIEINLYNFDWVGLRKNRIRFFNMIPYTVDDYLWGAAYQGSIPDEDGEGAEFPFHYIHALNFSSCFLKWDENTERFFFNISYIDDVGKDVCNPRSIMTKLNHKLFEINPFELENCVGIANQERSEGELIQVLFPGKINDNFKLSSGENAVSNSVVYVDRLGNKSHDKTHGKKLGRALLPTKILID